MARGPSEHHWEWADDKVAFYLYRYGDEGLGYSIAEIGQKRRMGERALRMQHNNLG